MFLCEYLPALKSISVILGTKSGVSSIRGIKLLDEKNLEIALQDGTVKIVLPTEVPLRNEPKIRIIDMKDNFVTLKIQLDILNTSSVNEKTMSFMEYNASAENRIWSCRDLKNKTELVDGKHVFSFHCAFCESKLLDSGIYKRFLDSPSEIWAEMMEFWHCHKPNEVNGVSPYKKYENLRLINGDVLLRPSHIMIASILDDSMQIEENRVRCHICRNLMGKLCEDKMIEINKWCLILKSKNLEEKFESYLSVYNLLMDKINSSACRKFLISCSEEESFFLWVMNIGVNVSTEYRVLKNSLKLLYRPKGKTEHMDAANIETIEIENSIYTALREELDRVNQSLPNKCRTVSLMDSNNRSKFTVSFLRGHI